MRRTFNRRLTLTSLLFALLFAGLSSRQSAQQKPPEKPLPTAPQQEPKIDPESVVRISTTLVQVDTVVTDKKGNHIQDLNQEDFELLVDGKKQELTYFNLVKLPDPKLPDPKATTAKSKDAPSGPPSTMPTKMIEADQVKRTIAFVVDDLGLSFQSTALARDALKKFVREQMQDGDLVGIIRTGRGLGALQQFTSDKRILYNAIDKLTWNPYGRDMIPRFASNDVNDTRPPESLEAEARAEDFRETVFSVGTLGALNFVVRGLRELPGRKMAILLSDGFRLFGRNGDNQQVIDNLRRLVDLSNRSSVVIYSIDTKGLQTLMPDASTSGAPQPEDFQRVSQENFDSQEGLTYVARETGGIAFLNANDINAGIRQSLKDSQSYYLLGFDPDDEKFDRKYHSIKVRVKRPGAQVRARAGFLGVADRARREDLAVRVGGVETRNQQIASALYSPFGARELSLQMTSFFFNSPNPKRGQKNEPNTISFVRSIYHIPYDKLTFKESAEVKGEKMLKLDIVSFTFNEQGLVVDQHGRSFSMNLTEDKYEAIKKRGLTYTDDFVLPKPGAYQFRTVLRDFETGQLGSASQFLQVPDLTKKRLALSGLLLALARDEVPADVQPVSDNDDVNPSPAVRRFSRTGMIDYGAVIYNPTLDAKTQKPNLMMKIEIYRDGKPIYQGEPRPVNAEGPTTGIQCGGRLRLKDFPPGEYMLHMVVTDTLAKQKFSRAEQWMDFSVK